MANPAPGFVKHPDYAVRIEPERGRVEVRVGETTVAASGRAVKLLETRHNPVWYLPMEDVDQTLIRATDTDTYCPFKGHASYWSVVTPDTTIEDAFWAYNAPYDECAEIAGYASFYGDKVDLFIDGEAADAQRPT